MAAQGRQSQRGVHRIRVCPAPTAQNRMQHLQEGIGTAHSDAMCACKAQAAVNNKLNMYPSGGCHQRFKP